MKIPFSPSKKTEHWCAECDERVVNSEDTKTGLFFLAHGHTYSKESGQYDGEYTGLMFAVCKPCLNKGD